MINLNLVINDKIVKYNVENEVKSIYLKDIAKDIIDSF